MLSGLKQEYQRGKKMSSMSQRPINDVRIGHASNREAVTGVTVILCHRGMTPGLDIRGSATSTRQIDSLFSRHIVPSIHGLCLTGGSAHGLEAGSGVLSYLESQGHGFGNEKVRVPIVPTAAIFDLMIGKPGLRPNAEMGYQACMNARMADKEEGSVGAGTGATVGKFYGIHQAMKGGLGRAWRRLKNGLVVHVLVVVNAYGDVRDPTSGEIIAGARKTRRGRRFADTFNLYKRGVTRPVPAFQNTMLGVIITNARLDKTAASLVSRLGQAGITKCVSPAHTIYDGDIVFTLASGEITVDPHTVGILAEAAFIEAILRAVEKSRSLGGVPAYSDGEASGG
jgi:L-aminopeptidase/D-esterase-like protein